MFDFHLHSKLSFDASEDMLSFCEQAAQMGMQEICFTEHVELDNIYANDWDGTVDYAEYTRQIEVARSRYPGLLIRQGLEVGLQPHTTRATSEHLRGQKLDFVIASQHVSRRGDPYSNKEFYSGLTLKQVVAGFLEETCECLSAFDDFDVVGHLSYVTLFAPEPEPVEYADYADILDEILKSVVARGKGIEINTTSYYFYDAPMATLSTLKRFRELGGEVVTIGSDAHYVVAMGHKYDQALEVLRAAGCEYVCTFAERQPSFHKLP